MNRLLLSAIVLGVGVACSLAALATWRSRKPLPKRPIVRPMPVSRDAAAEFEPPILLMSAGKAICAENPGFAAPCWADLKGDGKNYLLVGQFNNGNIQVYKHLGGEEFAAGEWLQADGNVAEVPGVW